jgi:diguanylate cyclase (GGDEF)-like protein
MGGFPQAFKLRLIALSMAVLFSIMAAVYFAVYVSTKDTIEEQLSLNAQGLAVAIAYIVMEDVDGYKTFLETKDIHSAYYRRMQSIFTKIKADSNVKYIYTERKIDARTFEYILDAEVIGHPDYSPPGSIEEADPRRDIVYSTERPAAFHLFKQSRWGVLISGFAPIRDHDEKILGIVGVDIDSSQLYNSFDRLQIILLAIYVGMTVITMLVFMKYADVFLEPLFKDKLTGAYNKRYAEKLIQEEIAAAVKGRKELSLMMLDLDHFKNINDTYGHGFGDKVLSFVSETIKKSLRENDYFIRYGGEEFIAIIPHVAENRAKEIAERIRHAVGESEIFNEEKNMFVKMTISIGIANLKDAAISVQEFIGSADRALYVAKVTRNCACTFEG